MYKVQMELTPRDIDIITMAVIDNIITGRLFNNKKEFLWDILESIESILNLSPSKMLLIYNSLIRYANMYQYERQNNIECIRVAKSILYTVRGGTHNE